MSLKNSSMISSGAPSLTISPSSRRITLSARNLWISGKWETNTTVIPSSSFAFLIASKISCLVFGQAIVAGSSRSMTLGFLAIWRAIISLCFSPPLNTEARWSFFSYRSTSLIMSIASLSNWSRASSKGTSPSSPYLAAYNFLRTLSITDSGQIPKDLWRCIAVSFLIWL